MTAHTAALLPISGFVLFAGCWSDKHELLAEATYPCAGETHQWDFRVGTVEPVDAVWLGVLDLPGGVWEQDVDLDGDDTGTSWQGALADERLECDLPSPVGAMVLASWQGRVERLDFVNGTALPPIGQASASPGLTHWSVEVDTDNEVAAVEISFWDYVDGRLHARYALEGGPCLWETAVSCFAVPCELDVITPIFDYYDADGLHLGSWR